MGDIAIKIENLSKQYRLGVVGTQTLRGDLQRFWWKLRGKGDPTLKVGQENTLAERGDSEYVWALQDINLEIKKGEVLGIIGKNGAGKSTLLKILSRVTGPTTGTIKVNGRLASLLEVGTGFHPELTGRENIYLNGAILGMTRAEINKQFDAIVDFAGIAKYIDTPVKRYSSGMYVRLGFAVAAHLNSEILVVDEVLAVGDAEFQKKAIGKMQDVSKGQGRTVLFVSHNMGSIRSLTERCIVMQKGRCIYDTNTADAIEKYLNEYKRKINEWKSADENDNAIQILEASLRDENDKIKSNFFTNEKLKVYIKYIVREPISGANISVNIHNHESIHVLSMEDTDSNKQLLGKREPGVYETIVEVPIDILNKGTYYLRIGSGAGGMEIFDRISDFSFTLEEAIEYQEKRHRAGIILPTTKWQLTKIE